MDEKELVGNCIDKLEGRVLVSAEEKERILTKIGCWSKKPRTEKLVAVMILPVIVIYSFFMAIKQVGHVSCIFFFVLSIVSVLSLIFLYFLGGVWPYYAWKDSVKKIRKNEVYKVRVVPKQVWQSPHWYKDYYMEIEGVNGEKLEGWCLISQELAKKWDKVNVWVYYHKATEGYAKFEFYVVEEIL